LFGTSAGNKTEAKIADTTGSVALRVSTKDTCMNSYPLFNATMPNANTADNTMRSCHIFLPVIAVGAFPVKHRTTQFPTTAATQN
jgi:hypothetical protein